MIIAGIGSRETPNDILEEMEEIGRQLARRNHWVRSGHADGADYAFERGAKQWTIVYLPWKGFNSKLPMLGKSAVVEDHPNRNRIVNEIHPNPDALSPSGRRLMQRNTAQVLGLNLRILSKAVVCWTPDGGATGGTGFAIRLAQQEEIPVINMYHSKWDTADKVLDRIL